MPTTSPPSQQEPAKKWTRRWPRSHRLDLGMISVMTVCLMTACAAHAAEERPRMVDNSSQLGVKDCVRKAAQAACDENLDAFLDCFTAQQRARIRRQTALLFVTHTLDFELLDSHVIDEDGDKAEIAVNYLVRLTDRTQAVVSILGLSHGEGRWLIAGENVQSTPANGAASSTRDSRSQFRFGAGGDAVFNANRAEEFLPRDIGRGPGGGCANGRCGR